ncbi:MAG: AAA family ATPase [Candidatus Longimicrobiales bacterium M2_2A_002]
MNQQILDALARSEAYPHPVDQVRVVQTHISVVFLAGPYAYKVKKPVQLDFVDFTTLERRRHFCHEEVRLNRRLAPDTYDGVVPIIEGPDGPRVSDEALDDPGETVALDAAEDVVEWAVRMERLPQQRTLKSLLRRGRLDGDDGVRLLRRVARLLVGFHTDADRGRAISGAADFRAVTAKAEDNLDGLEDAVGVTVSRTVLDRLREHSERALNRLRPLIEARARVDVPCDGHGDLRLGHVYHLDDGSPDGRLVVVDCVEFNDRFRYADPVADIAFLAMELEFEGRPDLAGIFTGAYLEAADDPDGAGLLPYYESYRDLVRGKVRTLAAQDPEIPPDEREKAAGRATRHFLSALGRLAPPDERPALVLLAGLPGVGKSVLARGLAEAADMAWIDTDRVRKRIAADGGPADSDGFEEGIYTPEWTERTYAECLREARSALFEGGRVVVEGSFRRGRRRAELLDAARELGVPAVLIVCEADRETVRRRLLNRDRNGADQASDADWSVYREMERRWEPVDRTRPEAHRIRTDRSPDRALREALRTLQQARLCTSDPF